MKRQIQYNYICRSICFVVLSVVSITKCFNSYMPQSSLSFTWLALFKLLFLLHRKISVILHWILFSDCLSLSINLMLLGLIAVQHKYVCVLCLVNLAIDVPVKLLFDSIRSTNCLILKFSYGEIYFHRILFLALFHPSY